MFCSCEITILMPLRLFVKLFLRTLQFRRLTKAVNVSIASKRGVKLGGDDTKTETGSEPPTPMAAAGGHHAKGPTDKLSYAAQLFADLGLKARREDDSSSDDEDSVAYGGVRGQRQTRKKPSVKFTINRKPLDVACLPVMLDSWKPGGNAT